MKRKQWTTDEFVDVYDGDLDEACRAACFLTLAGSMAGDEQGTDEIVAIAKEINRRRQLRDNVEVG